MPPRLEPVDFDPFEGAKGFFPTFDAAAPKSADDLPQPLFDDYPVSPGVKAINRLFGTGNEPRYVTWPEQMVRRGFDVVHSASQGDNQLESKVGLPGAQPAGSQDVNYEPNLLGKALGMPDTWRAPGHESGLAKVQDLSGMMAGGPLIERPGTATLGSGAVRPGEVALPKIETAPPFYSATEAAIRDASQASMSPEQWRGYLSNRPGVKAEELDWVGMPEGKKVTKQQMLDHLDEHGVQVKEVEKKGAGEIDEETARDQAYLRVRDENPPKHGESEDAWWERNHQEIEDHAYTLMEGSGEAGPKFSEYQLPGGENYREKLFTLPSGEKLHMQAHATEPGVVQVVGPKGDVRFEGSPEAARQYTQEVNQQSPQNYQSSHWDEPNVLAHVRMNDRVIDATPLADIEAKVAAAYPGQSPEHMASGMPSKALRDKVLTPQEAADWSRAKGWVSGHEDNPGTGLKTLHLEELQSDWHQAGRKQGYKEEPAAPIEVQGLQSGQKYYKVETPRGSTGNYDTPAEATAAARQLMNTGSLVPDAPFKTTWPDLVLKRMIREASENGYDAISWTPGEAHNRRYPGRPDKEQRGMEEFYDKIIVNKANALAKKFGGKVEYKNAPGTVEPKNPAEIYEALPRLKNDWPTLKEFVNHYNELNSEHRADLVYEAKETASGMKVPVLRLTPQMKDTALRRGFPLFSSGVPFPLIPVDHDPFAEDQK